MLRDGMNWPDGYPAGGGGRGRGTPEPAIVSVPPLPKRDPKEFFWITPAQGKAVKEFVTNGGSALFFHNVTYISRTTTTFAMCLVRSPKDIRPFAP